MSPPRAGPDQWRLRSAVRWTLKSHVEVGLHLQLVQPLALRLLHDLALKPLKHLSLGRVKAGVPRRLAFRELENDERVGDGNGRRHLAGLERHHRILELGCEGRLGAVDSLLAAMGGANAEVPTGVARGRVVGVARRKDAEIVPAASPARQILWRAPVAPAKPPCSIREADAEQSNGLGNRGGAVLREGFGRTCF